MPILFDCMKRVVCRKYAYHPIFVWFNSEVEPAPENLPPTSEFLKANGKSEHFPKNLLLFEKESYDTQTAE